MSTKRTLKTWLWKWVTGSFCLEDFFSIAGTIHSHLEQVRQGLFHTMNTNLVRLHSGAAARFAEATGTGRAPTILMVHGWKSRDPLKSNGSYAVLQEKLTAAGFNSLVISLRGHAGAEGDIETVTRAEHLEDLTAAVTWLMHHPRVDGLRLGAYATSYGAYILAASAWCPVMKWLAFRVAALYPDGNWDASAQKVINSPERQAWRSAVHAPEESRALKGIKRFRGHLVLFDSEHDEYMPPQIAESYRQAARGNASSVESVVMAGATHVLDAAQSAEFSGLLLKWFSDHSQSLP